MIAVFPHFWYFQPFSVIAHVTVLEQIILENVKLNVHDLITQFVTMVYNKYKNEIFIYTIKSPHLSDDLNIDDILHTISLFLCGYLVLS